MHVIYIINFRLELQCLLKKPYQKSLGSFKDLSIHTLERPMSSSGLWWADDDDDDDEAYIGLSLCQIARSDFALYYVMIMIQRCIG
jgi:hypothetical protein